MVDHTKVIVPRYISIIEIISIRHSQAMWSSHYSPGKHVAQVCRKIINRPIRKSKQICHTTTSADVNFSRLVIRRNTIFIRLLKIVQTQHGPESKSRIVTSSPSTSAEPRTVGWKHARVILIYVIPSNRAGYEV